MANLSVNNYRMLRLRFDTSYYWDFFINKDKTSPTYYNGGMSVDGLSCFIDMSDERCVGDGWIYSSGDYAWENAVSNGVTMNNIGYTGVDNGLIQYRRDRISNKDFLEYFRNSTFSIESGDTRLQLHNVSGTTGLYEYPVTVEDGAATLNGGFYQGFFKTTCDEYYILPSELAAGEEWNFEFVLNKCEMESQGDTLNNRYPENKGIFFFMGTRAENKWSYLYNEHDESAEECNQVDMEDYVEDGKIDVNTYGIDMFYDPNPEFEWTEEDENKWFYDYSDDDYTNYFYFDPSLYNQETDDMDSYLDFETGIVVIDESLPHVEVGNCNGKCTKKDEEASTQFKYVKVPFISCGCGKRYRTKKVAVTGSSEGTDWISPGEDFGDDYISSFDGLDCDFDYIEPELNIEDFVYETDNGFELSESGQYYFYTDNKFMMFDRTPTGYRVDNWVEGTKMMYRGRKTNFKGNLFVLMNRTCTGYTVHDIDQLIEESSEGYDTYKDIYNNAMAFQIDDNGALSYRILTVDCELSGDNKSSIISGKTADNVISDCEWHDISIRMIGHPKTMTMMFYVDGKLVFISKEVPKLDLRALDDIKEKQEGVPFNISIGGGTQGLAETIVKNYMMNPYRTYPLEKYFAGSFIGQFKSFKFYTTKNDFTIIRNNYLYESSRWL